MTTLLDFIVIGGYFALVMGIGLWMGRKEDTMDGFALGDRQIPWWAVLASILAAEISAATFLGAPSEGFVNRNFTYAQLAIGTVMARVLVSYIFLKPFYDYNVVSIYEFLEIRFGKLTRNAASGLFLITRALASGTRLYVAAVILVLAIEKGTGIHPAPLEELGIYIGSLVFLTVLTALYTTLGGIKAVVWTDVIQVVVLFSALGFAICTLLNEIPNGWSGARSMLQGPNDLIFFDLGWNSDISIWGNIKSILEADYTLWAALIGSTFITMATHGTDQDMVQRMLTAKDHHKSRWALMLSGLADIPIVLAFLMVGILLWAFYQHHPDPNLPQKQVFAYYIIHELPSGIRGLLVAGIFATAMGSLSTALNALATSFTRDWYLPYLQPKATQQMTLRAARWSTVFFAVALITIGALTAWAVLMIPKARIIPIVLGIFGYTYGSLLGVFLLGMLTRTRGNDTGNLWAMAIGFLVTAWLSGLHSDIITLCGGTPSPRADWIPTISFPWRILFGSLTTLAVAICFKSSHPILPIKSSPLTKSD